MKLRVTGFLAVAGFRPAVVSVFPTVACPGGCCFTPYVFSRPPSPLRV